MVCVNSMTASQISTVYVCFGLYKLEVFRNQNFLTLSLFINNLGMKKGVNYNTSNAEPNTAKKLDVIRAAQLVMTIIICSLFKVLCVILVW